MEILFAFSALLAVLLLGMPIGFAMGLAGVIGLALHLDLAAALSLVGSTASDTVLTYEFAVLPLFILMGNLVARSGIAHELYEAAHAWLGHMRGGLAMATVASCGGFAAVSGSSLATAATMAKVAVPPMRRYRYADSLIAGSIGAGGTLGIMIPPSVPLVLYGFMTETDIGKLFAAGVLPGILGVLLYIAAVRASTLWRRDAGPSAPRMPFLSRLVALRGVTGILVLFAIVIGGLYGGLFTPTEAAGMGAGGAFAIAVIRRKVSVRDVYDVLVESGRTTVMMIVILIGALLFARYVNIANYPQMVTQWIAAMELSPLGVIIVILSIYLLLGCVMESISMMLLTVPVFYPVVAGLGFDLVWFGILVIVVIEVSLITPPVGLNAFVLRAVLPDISLRTIFAGLAPFVVADVVRIALLIGFPAISLTLPSLMR